MRLFFAELSLHQPERLPRHVGAGVRDALAVANLLGLGVVLRREHGLGAVDELLHQLLGRIPSSAIGRAVMCPDGSSGRKMLNRLSSALTSPGWFTNGVPAVMSGKMTV